MHQNKQYKGLIFTILLFLFVLLANQAKAIDTIYIDPSYVGNSNGTLLKPYNSISTDLFKQESVYLFRRGTGLVVTKTIDLPSNIELNAYGNGPKPKIYGQFTSRDGEYLFKVYKGTNVRLRNLDLSGQNLISTVYFLHSSNCTVDSCLIKYGFNGVRSIGECSYNSVTRTIISDTSDDGIFMVGDNTVISYCHISRVNTRFLENKDQKVSSGDAIQLSHSCRNFYVHNNFLDHSAFGNKFCFIAEDSIPDEGGGVFEYNYCIGQGKDGFSVIYLGALGEKVVVRNNFFTNAAVGVFLWAPTVEIYGNIFYDNIKGIRFAGKNNTSKYTTYNNTFYNNKIAIETDKAEVIIFNNIVWLKNDDDLFLNSKHSNFRLLTNCVYPNTKFALVINNVTINLLAFYDDASLLLTENPGFVNPDDKNFNLLQGSPCIDAGLEIDYKRDYNGNKRICGPKPDLGANEYCLDPNFNYK